jgi:hypothetical protein
MTAAKIWIAKAIAEDVEQVEALTLLEPRGAHGIVVELTGLGSRIPALHDLLMMSVGRCRLVLLEPLPTDQLTFDRNWVLLMLGSEMVGAD